MTATRFLATALPYSLAKDGPFHASVVFTHRLEPETPEATLSDFPAARRWVETLRGGTLELITDRSAAPIPLRWVSAPSQDAWSAAFPADTPVSGFAAPPSAATDDPWRTYPAHSMEQHALDLHLGSTFVSPMTPPRVRGNPLAEKFLDEFWRADHAGVARLMNDAAELYPGRDDAILGRKLDETAATLGIYGKEPDLPQLLVERGGYAAEPVEWTSAVEVLLADPDGDQLVTAYLDRLVDDLEQADPAAPGTGPASSSPGATGLSPAQRILAEVHAARRFYQREPEDYQARPDPHGSAGPVSRLQTPKQDFHQRAASLGSTPVLMRTVGLVVDVAVDDPRHRQVLAEAAWVAVRFTPDNRSHVKVLSAPRTLCESDGRGHWRAVSSDAWSGGALPLGLPTAYTVLDLDPDASGLKLEQHLRGLPRTLATELNGDPVNAAPASLRSTGFSIAKLDRESTLRAQIERAKTFRADEDGSAGPDLVYDDVVRGVRLEVWDDQSKAWHSVHERRVDVEADGQALLEDVSDVGFLQLTGLTKAPGEANPYHLHEVFVGWDGWSLSAPRPGKVIVHGDGVNGPAGEELVLDAPPGEPAGHVHIRSRVEPGTLPWLRYGRRYSFRVRGVDLAGNSVPRPRTRAVVLGRKELSAAAERLQLLRRTYAAQERSGLLGSVRESLLDQLPTPPGGGPLWAALADAKVQGNTAAWAMLDQSLSQTRAATEAERVRLPQAAATGVPEVDELLTDRLREQVERTSGAKGTGLREGVAHALREVGTAETWRVRAQLAVDPREFAGLDDTSDPLVANPPTVRLPGGRIPRPPLQLPEAPVVTTPRPFLRWHPVPPPSVVARHPLRPGESLQRLVVRDDGTSERHLAPPKSTQLEAEQHGKFDPVIGSQDPAAPDTLLATALKERGTFLDERIQDLNDPGATVVQEGIELCARPGADPDSMVTLAQIAEDRDTPLGEGQYVIHDTDQLVVPYLPDPLARGVALVFYDAGAPHSLFFPRVLQTVVLEYDGTWPEVEPLRLVLAAGTELGARRDGNTVRVTVPPGEQVRVAMSSALDEEGLAVLGPWRAHPAAASGGAGGPKAEPARALLARAARNGWFWWLTPSHDLRLVHAVRRPVTPPQIPALRVLLRPPGLTVAALVGVVDVHGPSTERISLVARWSEWVDDLAADGPVQVEREDVVLTSPVQPDERFGVLYLVDHVLTGTDGETTVVSHKAIQNFPDTHHRRVTYAARGVTRYAEFFEPAELPAADDPTLLGEARELTVVSSARPAAPEVSAVLPLLLWETQTEPEQPFALRRTRRSGARIWLHRPWFSSGDGELLAVVLGSANLPPSVTSRWARDPVLWTVTPGSTTELPLVEQTDLVIDEAAGHVVGPRPGRPVTTRVRTTLTDLPEQPGVDVLGYQPEYHPGRQQWFVDVAMDPGDSLWPFVRLTVARYQPDSLPEHDLSPVVLTDWVQPLPERIATVSRPQDSSARVTVTGPIGFTRVLLDAEPGDGLLAELDGMLRVSREVFVTAQALPPHGGDLDWEDHERVRLPLAGWSGMRATWSAEVPLPEPVAMATPGSSERFRVLVEEFEYVHADPDDGPKEGPPGTARRLVYADHFAL